MAFTQEQKIKYDEKYNLDNPLHKQIILDFEREFGHLNFIEILQKKGYWKINDWYKNGYIDGHFIAEINDLQEKYKALGKLIERRYYMERKDKEINEQLYEK